MFKIYENFGNNSFLIGEFEDEYEALEFLHMEINRHAQEITDISEEDAWELAASYYSIEQD